MKRKTPYSKYHNKRSDGFDSQKERNRWDELRIMEMGGIIHDLRRQVKFVLIPTQREFTTELYTKGRNKGRLKPGKVLENECSYYADFVYVQDGKTIVEDCKGYRTADYIIKRKLMLKEYGIRIYET